MQATTFAPLSNEQLYRIAPSIFANHADDQRSARYRFVPTIDVVEALRGEGFFPVKVAASRSKNEDGVEYVKHTIRLRRQQDMQTKLAKVGQILPEIALTNSHDGSSGFVLDPALLRLVCTNGLLVSDSQGPLRYRHTGGDDLVGRIIEGAYEVVQDFPLIADRIDEWSSVELDHDQRRAFAKGAIKLRFDDSVQVIPDDMLRPRRYGDSRHDLFTTFNVVQENIIRGGVRSRNAKNRTTSSRKITSVDRDLKLNRALWTLADEMARLVKGV